MVKIGTFVPTVFIAFGSNIKSIILLQDFILMVLIVLECLRIMPGKNLKAVF